jgi:hypothetical protein
VGSERVLSAFLPGPEKNLKLNKNLKYNLKKTQILISKFVSEAITETMYNSNYVFVQKHNS